MMGCHTGGDCRHNDIIASLESEIAELRKALKFFVAMADESIQQTDEWAAVETACLHAKEILYKLDGQ